MPLRTCKNCSATFSVPPNKLKLGRGSYCCRACRWSHERSPARLRQKILSRSIPSVDGCRLWIGARDRDGYGRYSISRTKSVRAHRIAYQAFVGPIPSGHRVLHTCDTPACVLPCHLFTGTHETNMADCVSKGRKRRAALTPEDIRAIRSRYGRYNVGGESACSLGREFRVSAPTILDIVHFRTWTHIR
jgi:hypothetical protein